ncbi:MAG: OsmC family protein [Myxococcota bacterium]|nr:OsmC family protein [Myxococcota bacterium]
MEPRDPNLMRNRQKPLIELYGREPKAAWVIDTARTEWADDDPLHTSVFVGPDEPTRIPIAVHGAVGGDSDQAVPGDVLAAALASCLDSTMRVVANRLGIPLRRLSVHVHAEVDVRGTLLVSSDVPVGFQRMSVRVELETAPSVDAGKRASLLGLAEKCCVVMQTLRAGVPIEVRIEDSTESAGRSAKPSST